MTNEEALAWTPDEEEFYSLQQAELIKIWDEAGLSEGEKNYWRQKETEISTPYVFHYREAYYILFRAITTIGLSMLLFLAVCLSNIFTEEHIKRTDQIILCSRYGKEKVYSAKILAGISFCAGAAFLVSLGTFLFAFCIYGAEGSTTAFQLVYGRSSCSFSIGEAVLILYGILMVTMVLFGILVMVLSELLRNGIATLSTATGLLIMGMIISIPGQYRALAQMWDYLPWAFLSPWKIFDIRLLPVFGGYFTAWQAVPVLYVAVGLVTFFIGKIVYGRYQVSGR